MMSYRKWSVISLMIALITLTANAETVEIDGIYYNLIRKGMVAEVTNNPQQYYGTIVIPETVTYEGNEFLVNSINPTAFSSCYSLSAVTIPNSITVIKSGTFSTSSLSSVTIPCSMKEFESAAFGRYLSSIYISDIKAWCEMSISSDAFGYYPSRTFHLFLNNEEIIDLNIPNDVVKINDYVFNYCRGIKSVRIPNSVTSIGDNSFHECSGIVEMTIANGVSKIGNMAFEGCSELTSVTIPNSVTSIGTRAFMNCRKLKNIQISDNVSTIGDYTFSGCSDLSSVTLGDNVKTIGNNAFQSCTSLSSVHLPNNLTSIGSYAFQGCISLTSINIPNSVTSINQYAFSQCSNLVSVSIPNSKLSIGTNAFYECKMLENVYISDIKSWCDTNFEGVTSNPLLYAHHLFLNNNEISELTIPSNVNSIGRYAFYGFSGLTSVNLSNNTTMIRFKAFSNCINLHTITLGNGLQFIQEEAFANCPELTDVYCYSENVPRVNNTTFDGSYIEYATLHVPGISIEAYKSTAPWSGFKDVVKIVVPKHLLIYMIDEEEYRCYEIEEGTQIIPETTPTKEGYTFSGWSEMPETMPAHDVVVTGSFTVNSYTVKFKYGDEILTTTKVEYGAVIPLPESLDSDRYTLVEWLDVPATMPAHDITIQASFTDGVKDIQGNNQDAEYYQLNGMKRENLQRGLNIIRMNDGTTRKVMTK